MYGLKNVVLSTEEAAGAFSTWEGCPFFQGRFASASQALGRSIPLKLSLKLGTIAFALLACLSACGPDDQMQNESTSEVNLAQTRAGLVLTGYTYTMPARGGWGGGFSSLSCSQGYVAVGIFGRSGGYIDQVGLECAFMYSDGSLSEWSRYRTGTAGGYGGGPFSITCPSNQAIVGLKGRSGGYVDRLGIFCSTVSNWRTYATIQHASSEAGGTGGGYFSDTCPGSYVLTTLNLRAGGYVDQEQGVCSYVAP